jgi:cell division protease FtsH
MFYLYKTNSKNVATPSIPKIPRAMSDSGTFYIPPLDSNIHPIESVRSTSEKYQLFDQKTAPSIHIENNTISYSDLLVAIRKGLVKNAVVSSNMRIAKVDILAKDDIKTIKVVFPEDYDIVNFLVGNKVNVTISETNTIDLPGDKQISKFDNVSKGILTILQVLFQVAFIGMIINLIMASRNGGMNGGNGGVFGMTSSRATLFNPTMVNTGFADVAGAENAKQDLAEIVDFLKYPEKYTKLGARIPKGVLLYGPPGCGKTLLARSVAGEAGVPFFSTSGSSMVEVFVGVAAARIRDMFNKAKEKSPCIIFIDEIDAIGKARSMSLGSGANDERDQALNQLLTEMDGFDVNHGVIVIAATNRPDILDEALTRPGRFDRRISVEYPDMKGRTEILAVHTKGMPLSSDVNLNKLAKNTIGFSGADLKNLCNEAAIYAARSSSDTVSNENFDQSLEKLTMGEIRTTMIVSEQKKKIIAYHEAGHTLLALIVNEFDNIRKVTITPRGSSGGATYFEPNEDRIDGGLLTREYLQNKLIVALGGRVAEEIVFGEMKATTGASADFEIVTSIATDMVCRYGFNEQLGPMFVDNEKSMIDTNSEIRFLIDNAYKKACQMLKENEFYLHRIADALLEKETLDEKDLGRIIEGISCSMDNTEITESFDLIDSIAKIEYSSEKDFSD